MDHITAHPIQDFRCDAHPQLPTLGLLTLHTAAGIHVYTVDKHTAQRLSAELAKLAGQLITKQ